MRTRSGLILSTGRPICCCTKWTCQAHSQAALVCVNFFTFRVRRSRGEVYIGHGRLCVCLCLFVCRRIPTLLHDVTSGNGRGCPLVVHYWADLQLMHGFHCCNNIAPNAECHRVLVLALCLVCYLSLSAIAFSGLRLLVGCQ